MVLMPTEKKTLLRRVRTYESLSLMKSLLQGAMACVYVQNMVYVPYALRDLYIWSAVVVKNMPTSMDVNDDNRKKEPFSGR